MHSWCQCLCDAFDAAISRRARGRPPLYMAKLGTWRAWFRLCLALLGLGFASAVYKLAVVSGLVGHVPNPRTGWITPAVALALCGLLAPTLVVRARLRREVRDHDLNICPVCGYWLRGLAGPGRCPECGCDGIGTARRIWARWVESGSTMDQSPP
jgi:hypothetical protein